MEFHQDLHVRPCFVKVHYFQVDYCIKTSKEKMRIYVTKLSYSAFSIFSNVRKVNLVYPIRNGSCHKQQMINNDKLNHGKPQLQL